MKITVSRNNFVAAFHSAGRGDKFSHAALLALFNWIEERERELGEEFELDVSGLCVEWTEYPDAIVAAEAYGWADKPEREEGEPEEEYGSHCDDVAADWLADRTEVIHLDGSGIVVLDF